MGHENAVAHVTEGNGHVSVTLKQPTDAHLNEAFQLKCFPDILSLAVFPNVKEITESMAAFAAARNWLGAEELREPWTLYAVGDGKHPRTAALFAHLTKPQVHACATPGACKPPPYTPDGYGRLPRTRRG